MTITAREWLFSAKALIAALMATRSKGIYRALGTLLGAAASVVLLPAFAQQPIMLSLTMSLWIGALLYLAAGSLAAQLHLSAGGLHGAADQLAEVNHPATIFDVALAL